MNSLTNWIKDHQIISFFAITFAITWGLGFSYSGVLESGQFFLAPLVFTATCGPALAGIIIASISNTQPKRGSRKAFWIGFFLAWAVSGLVAIAFNTLFNNVPISPWTIGLVMVSVLPVAFVISMAYSRTPAVREFVSSLIRLRGVWGWSLVALVLLPALILLSVPVSSVLYGQSIKAHTFPELSLSLIGLIAVRFFYQLFFFNATGEETGWRGFALPRLQAQTSPLIAALIIALFWAPWHFFLWQAEGRPVSSLEFWIDYYPGHFLFSVILVWICNRASGSILVAGIAHASANTAFAFAQLQNMRGLNLTWLVAALVLILVDRMWRKLPPDNLAVYQAPRTVSSARQLGAI